MEYDTGIALVARLLANPARAAMLDVLLDGEAHTAGELARGAGVAPSTASRHLAMLFDGGFVSVRRSGRQRRYRLASPVVARVMESLALLAPPEQVSSLRQATEAHHLRMGRTCYDHLAGRLGIAITDALIARRVIQVRKDTFDLTRSGRAFLEGIGIDVAAVRGSRRGFALACEDWTERRFHLAGAVGAALCERLFELRWVRRRPSGRSVVLTAQGRAELTALLGIGLGTGPGIEPIAGTHVNAVRRSRPASVP